MIREMSRRGMSAIVLTLVLAACGSHTPAPQKPAESTSTPAPAAAPSGPATAAPAQGPDLKIGVLLPLTGPAAAGGTGVLKGVEMAVKWTNDNGGINGRKVVIVKSDAPTPQDAVGAAERLILQEKVKVITGSATSGIAIPASEVAARNQVVYWEQSAATPQFTERGLRHVFRTIVTPASPGFFSDLADFLKDAVAPALGKSPKDIRVSIINEDGPYGSSMVQGYAPALKAAGFDVESLAYAATTNDMTPVLTKLMARKTDVVVTIGYFNDTVLYMRQSKELGFRPPVIVGLGGTFSDPKFKEAMGDLEGLVTMGATALAFPDRLDKGLKPNVADAVALYKSLYNAEPGEGEILAFGSTMALFDVLAKASNPDSADDIIRAAEALDIPDGKTVMGWGIKFDQKHQNTRSRFFMMQWQGGKLQGIYPEQFKAVPFKLLNK